MRWICKDDIKECLTQAWRDKADAAKVKLLAAADTEERKKILKRDSSSNVWRDYYELLPESLKKKCWYCEAADIRSDMPIDHFRPKNEVEEESGHEGYWWLAFDWENYRCACTFCNSRRNFEETQGGKTCKFPLCNPESRAFSPDDEVLLQQELPDFLDPFNPDDEKLLWFDNDGIPIPKPDSTVEQERKVNNSIDIFHLHETNIVRARNNIRIEVIELVTNLRKGEDVQKTKTKLKRMVKDTTKLSRAAVVYLRAHRDLPEVADILQID